MSISPVLFAESLWIRKCFIASSRGFLFYDYFLTLDDEIQYIWNAPWGVVKITYLLNRYGSILGNVVIGLEEFEIVGHGLPTFCSSFRLFSTVFAVLAVESIHILVLMRAWAIWGCQRTVAVWLGVLYGIYVVFLIVIFNLGLGKKPYVQGQDVMVSDNLTNQMVFEDYIWLAYVASFVLDTAMFIITMRSLYTYSRIRRQLYPSHLLRSLYGDAIAFFIASIFSDTFTVVAFIAFPDDPKNVLAKGFALPLLSVTGQRLVLNLRGLKSSTFSTADLSVEIARQLDLLAAAGLGSIPERDGANRECHASPGDTEVIELGDGTGARGIELRDIEVAGSDVN
ncbi:hypothetical protein BV22DRAFT_1133965 [Leucogyrophana mollusca]|uniref:Uncharacterized protein n=1 Tax=Leucogyrophana mollusca TaxID=85980 RepID=A0ACB8B323_9AGAM|nr:hypothetical protein BV22DRAFT_1133965 [Leucogyrophana mollusca]